ncbi:hypothetical protein ABVT39_018860 [Epinephelus coioides]
MEMIVLEEESEISVVNENFHDASAENAASKIHFVEDNDVPAAVPGLEEVGNSCCRDTAVFLVCFVSLTGLILSVSSVNLFVYTSKTVTRHNSEWESKTDQLQTSYNNNLIKERDQLQTSYDNLIKERDRLQTSCSNLTNERDQLQTSCTNLTKNNNQLQTSYNKLTKKHGDLQRKLKGIEASCKNLTEEREELKKNLHDFATGVLGSLTIKKMKTVLKQSIMIRKAAGMMESVPFYTYGCVKRKSFHNSASTPTKLRTISAFLNFS